MNAESLKARRLEDEFIFAASRSSGPGGQNVNKVNSKVEIRFNVKDSAILSEAEKEVIFLKLNKKINLSGELIITSQSERSQLKNRERAIEKMFRLLERSLIKDPVRRPTTPTEKSKSERLDAKHRKGRTKVLRKVTDENPDQD